MLASDANRSLIPDLGFFVTFFIAQGGFVPLSIQSVNRNTASIGHMRTWVTMAPNRTTSAVDQNTIFTSFPSPSVPVHIVRKRSVEAVNSARRKRRFFVVLIEFFHVC